MAVHIIGAGMAGLSAAVTLVDKGIPVSLYDSAPHAGGRCYSFYDKKLDMVLNNGTHMILGSNTALLDMLAKLPSPYPLEPIKNDFLMYQVRRDQFFNIDLNHPFKAIPYLPKIYRLLTESVMNTPVGQADMLMLIKTALKCLGPQNGQVYLPSGSLKEAVVDPLTTYLESKGAKFFFSTKLWAFRKNRLIFHQDQEEVPLLPDDKIILALPVQYLHLFLPGMPELKCQTIINIHFKTERKLPDDRRFVGLINSIGHWVFEHNGVLSVTISAASSLYRTMKPEEIVKRVWEEIVPLLSSAEKTIPPYRLVVDRRATLEQNVATNMVRPRTDMAGTTIFIAGDGTDTGLPCTIEGAVRSGIAAAEAILFTV